VEVEVLLGMAFKDEFALLREYQSSEQIKLEYQQQKNFETKISKIKYRSQIRNLLLLA
jgi:hypothetical protein